MNASSTNCAPLVDREPDDWIAHLSAPKPSLGLDAGPVTVAQFMGHVRQLADQLPSHTYVINLCENRYLFMVAFCAAILRSQTNLLPPNKTLVTQQSLFSRYNSCYVIHDGIDVADNIPQLDIGTCSLVREPNREIPMISLDFLAAITFTSGSTGESKPNQKYWRTFVVSTHINARYMLASPEHTVCELATVPGQHMWGMETSVLLALMKNVCVSDARPLFPKDIASQLATLPAPRMLVSTPVHLRAMVMSGLSFPPVELVLCATAPLAKELAGDAESLFGGVLQEVYGCSEVGSMSYRRTSQTDCWNIFSGLDFVDEAGDVVVYGDHLPLSITLQDKLHLMEGEQFRLVGRSDDMIEIAGKRGSLQELNKILLSSPGVLDGAVFMPRNTGDNVGRVVALVVLEKNAKKETVADNFKQRLDPVFVPRPIYVVDQLPREENGKLPRAKLLQFYSSLKKSLG